MGNPNRNKTGSTILKEWTTSDCRNTPSNINLEEDEIVGALRNDGNASMPEQVKRPNPRKKMTIIITVHAAVNMIQLRSQFSGWLVCWLL